MANGRSETVLETRERRSEEQEVMSSDKIVGKSVKNMEGYDLGEISNLRVSLPKGRVVYAVLKYGGTLGIGGKRFAIPVEAMVYRPGDDVFVVNIEKRRLDDEPGFSEGDWPREANWSLIASTRPLAPPRAEEAHAIAESEVPPPEVVTTERVEVRERAGTEAERPVTEERREGGVAEPQPSTATRFGEMEEQRPITEPYPEREETAGMEHMSAADLQVYLKGMEYPAGKQDLIDQARKNDAPDTAVRILEQLADTTYHSPAEVSQEFGRVKK